jgi:thiol-disulfide isomerase/thioredoxin
MKIRNFAIITLVAFAFASNGDGGPKVPYAKAAAAVQNKFAPLIKDNPKKASAEYLKAAKQLAEHYPKETGPWMLMMQAATYSGNEQIKIGVLNEMADHENPQLSGVALRFMSMMWKQSNPIGKPFQLQFTGIDGKQVDLAKLKGKVVLIDFWATWCGPCVAEIPNLVKTYNEFHDQGFEIVGIALEGNKDPKRLQAYVARKNMPWPQYTDGLMWKNKIAQRYGINGVPTMWLIDREGNLSSLTARINLKNKVKKLLAEKSASTSN